MTTPRPRIEIACDGKEIAKYCPAWTADQTASPTHAVSVYRNLLAKKETVTKSPLRIVSRLQSSMRLAAAAPTPVISAFRFQLWPGRFSVVGTAAEFALQMQGNGYPEPKVAQAADQHRTSAFDVA